MNFDLSQHIMLDLETVGVKPGCVVLTIGATTFDIKDTFYEKISLQDSLAEGFVEDINTQRWWAKQDPRARQEAFSGIDEVRFVAVKFSDWFRKRPDAEIWGNGADFDLPILAAVYHKLGLPVPWKPFNGRCYRTLKNLLPHVAAPGKNAMKHNALEDAVFQANHAVSLLQVI